MLLPENLRSNVTDTAWLTALPALIADVAARWSLRLGEPYQPGGAASWVAPAVRSDGSRAVVKIGWPHYEARDEAAGLRVWSGQGVVRLLDIHQYADTSALLIEECRPGTTLAAALPEESRDEVLAAILPRLWITPPPGHPFRPLTSMCDAWAATYDVRAAPDPGLARAALDLWHALPRSAPRSVLLCTDLHPGNILAAEREPWLVVDPKPYVGDPDYEPAQHMLNFPARLAAGPVAFATRMAALLDLDAARVRGYLFARCVLESRTTPSLWPVAVRLAP